VFYPVFKLGFIAKFLVPDVCFKPVQLTDQLKCLGRLSDPPRPRPLAPPPALKLVTEPVADTRRYDRLRRNKQ
jgi:hypothetical protein